MRRRLVFAGVIFALLLASTVATISVRAEDDPPPTPPPVKPPWITGKNPQVSISTSELTYLTPAGIIEYSPGLEVPLLSAPPDYVDLVPQESVDPSLKMDPLAVPQRFQDPLDNTCGAAALGMALEFLSLNGEGSAPSQETLVDDLKNRGLLYETGTGAEELAFLARQHGFRGTNPFHDWTLAQLKEQLGEGRPVVVALGSNGENQPGHFVTLTGISADGKWVNYNDPIVGKQVLSAADFQKLWDLQGNAGLMVRKEPISAVDDPMLPWMGLLSAMAAMAVMAKHYPLGSELTSTLENIRHVLSNPLRKGLAGKLIAGGGSSSSPPSIAPPGYSWKKTTVPKYGWKDVTQTEKVEVPNLVRTWAVVKVNRWIERVPVYKTVAIDRGHWAYRTVTQYRTERYRTTERYKTKKYYWYRRNGRLVRGSYDVWKTRTVVKTRKVPYTERQKYWVPKIVTEKRLDHYREIEHRDPVYGWREEKQGTRIEEHTKTTRSWAPVGTEIKWELKKNPLPTPTPPNPTPTPTPYPTSTPYPLPVPTPVTTPTPYIEGGSGTTIWDELMQGIAGTAISIGNTINEKVIEPVKNTVLSEEWWQDKAKKIGKRILDQKVFSISASDQWDVNMYSQAGVITQSTPYNMFFVNQTLKLNTKLKLTGNPGSFSDVDVTSGTFTMNLTEVLSIFGSVNGGSIGYGLKRPGGNTHDYIMDKVSIGLSPKGPTITYRQEGVDVQLENKEENFEVKTISTIACETQTLRTEGLVLIGGVIMLAVVFGPEILALGGPAVLERLIPAFGH